MKVILCAVVFALSLVNAVGQAKVLTNDPLTGLPLTPASNPGRNLGNEPNSLPDSQVCKSKMKGNFYMLYDVKVDAVVAWYASHLSAFKKTQGFGSGRSQTAFSNSDRTILVIVTGDPGAKGENTNAYSVAYERYDPGLPEQTITGLAQGKMVCQ
ncbi:MAG TPA: hypothetical protein VGG04_04415 [Candidatus Sulfotelmatobacter sp.]